MFERFTHRRGFLARATAAAASVLAMKAMPGSADDLLAQGQSAADPDKWLAGITGKHRCLFDAPTSDGGLPLIHMLNYINTYKNAYGVPSSEVNAIGTFYGPPAPTASMPLGWNDSLWAKYKLGEMLNLTDPATKAPTTRNMYFRPKAGDPVFFNGMVLPAGIESLQKLGSTFLLCNNALMAWVGFLAGKSGGKPADVEKEIRANLLPGVTVVPAMVIAIEKAQGKGIAYNKQ